MVDSLPDIQERKNKRRKSRERKLESKSRSRLSEEDNRLKNYKYLRRTMKEQNDDGNEGFGG